MSTVVADITAALKSEIETALGAGWSQLKFVFEPEKNDFRSVQQGYGLIQGPTDPVEGTLRVYTVDQEYRVILTRRVASRLSDRDYETDKNALFENAHKIFQRLVLTKGGLPSKILLIDGPSMSEPEILEEQIALLELSFVVKYREALAV